jgi:hypothetical protein
MKTMIPCLLLLLHSVVLLFSYWFSGEIKRYESEKFVLSMCKISPITSGLTQDYNRLIVQSTSTEAFIGKN